ncbi:hypothetical protein Q7P37_008450 [Cladosporium fusiforme]
MAAFNIPSLPVPPRRFIEHVAANPSTPISELLQPFKQYEDELRKVFAQQPEHNVTKQPSIVPVFEGHEKNVQIRARDLTAEPKGLRETYIMPLRPAERKPDGALAIADSMQQFKANFNIFSESSLADLNWDNVIVAGSAVVTSLLSVPEQYSHSKRSLRLYYHEIVAPASDVDLFLYDLTEEQAVEKIKQIEKNVRDALLVETTTIRTKNTITIVSQYPVRHVQIVLRIYKSITEILTGFDVDCSCGAYDGKQVWASPRAIAAYMTQTNTLDLTRRSPSYENRLSKYRHRGFEVRFPELDRSRIDPTIYERSFSRTQGLARLLILERLPKSSEREAYIDQRRKEQGRPAADRSRMRQHFSRGDIKSKWEDEVAEWVEADEVSNYHTFTVPYGPNYHARKIEKLVYTKDLLLNAEWNKPKDREVNLHRHPAFFGSVDEVINDCCGHCPTPITIEEEEVAEQESKIYVAGTVAFMKDDCGRQAIGSFNPLSPDEYTDMAYIGNTELLCQAIIDRDLHYVEQWLRQEGNNPNTRDHTGRCPLHLAVSNSSLEVIQCLIDNGARLVARLVDGKTALHLASLRGDPSIVSALLRKSESNEGDELKKTDAKRKRRIAAKGIPTEPSADPSDSPNPKRQRMTEDADGPATSIQDFEMVDRPGTETDADAMTDGSMIRIKGPEADAEATLDGEDGDPDVYDVNVLAWDMPTSPLHLAILSGHQAVVECLVQEFGANILLPAILPDGALLTLTLAFRLPLEEAKGMTRLLFKLGASSAQADYKRKTALEYCVSNEPRLLETYLTSDPLGIARAIKHVSVQEHWQQATVSSPLQQAISRQDVNTATRLLSAGAKPDVPFEAYLNGVDKTAERSRFETRVEQPVVCAISSEQPHLASLLVEQYGVDSNTLTTKGASQLHFPYNRQEGQTLLDAVVKKIKELQEWKHNTPKCDPPVPLKDDGFYLNGFSEDTYQHHSAKMQLERAKRHYEKDMQRHTQEIADIASNEVGLDEKRAAVHERLDQFRELEATLRAQSAKTFRELYPETEEREAPSNSNRYDHDRHTEPFELTFGFKVAIPNEEIRSRYIALFEAAWRADVKTIKELTLLAWTDSEGEKRPPLQIAVQDKQNHSPFSIAVLRGNLDIAKMILEIAEAQYTPPDPPKARSYRVATDSESGEDEDGDDASDGCTGLPMASEEVIDDNLTIEDIGEVSLSVKSNIRPEDMVYWDTPKEPEHVRRGWTPHDLVQSALARGDTQLLSFLLDVSDHHVSQIDTTSAKRAHNNDRNPFHQYIETLPVLKLAEPHQLAELIKRTAFGMSIQELALENGENDTTAEPKYYQGLNVRGKKRKDWADAGRNTSSMDEGQQQVPPLLMAVYHGTLEQVEWILSDAPLRCYKHYAESHQTDKRLQKISERAGGVDGVFKAFLNSHSNLAIHCCLAREQTPHMLEILKYLVRALPDAVEARSAEKTTPLLRAFEARNFDAAKILIDAGADQTARDGAGNNLLHNLMLHHSNAHTDVARVRKLIEIIDKRLIPSMCLQRTTSYPGSLTPLAVRLQGLPGCKEFQTGVVALILEYSEGAELPLFNGQGDTVLHTVMRKIRDEYTDFDLYFQLVKIFLEHRPGLAHWENASGKTPLELIEDSVLAMKCSQSPDGRHYTARQFRPSDRSVVDREPRDFIERKDNLDPDSDENRNDRNPRGAGEMMKELLVSAQGKFDAQDGFKRRLIALNEASEVAERLASRQRERMEAEDKDAPTQDDGPKSAVCEIERWLLAGDWCHDGPKW